MYHKGWAVYVLPCSHVQLFYWRDSHRWSLNKFMVKLNRKRNLSYNIQDRWNSNFTFITTKVWKKNNNDNFTLFTLSYMNILLYALTHRTRNTFSNPRAEIGTRESQNGLENNVNKTFSTGIPSAFSLFFGFPLPHQLPVHGFLSQERLSEQFKIKVPDLASVSFSI